MMRFFVADGPEEDAWQEGGPGARRQEGWHESVPLIAGPTGGGAGSRRNLPTRSRGRSKLQPAEVGAISAV